MAAGCFGLAPLDKLADALGEGVEPVATGLLHRWESQVADGDYWLRLSAVDAAGNESVAEVVVTVVGSSGFGSNQ